tara:strand:+ start:1029 stop:1247 length:219 start_codon:yes stop_codon:yes gene_type:complete
VHDSRNRLSAWSGNTWNASTGLKLLALSVLAAARLRARRAGSSQTSTLHYDADGRRVSMTDSNGTDLGFNGF